MKTKVYDILREEFARIVRDKALEGEVVIKAAVLSPEEVVENLVSEVETLGDIEVLNRGQANALLQKLERILDALGRQKKNVACNVLRAFINQVMALAYPDGVLTPEEAQPLINAATNARAALACPTA